MTLVPVLGTVHKLLAGMGSNNAMDSSDERAKAKVDNKHVWITYYHLLLLDLLSPVTFLSEMGVVELAEIENCTP